MSLRARYLRSFDIKLAELREALGRLGGAGDAVSASADLRRRLQTLAGSGDVYGVSEVSEWARETLRVLDTIRSRTGPASAGDTDDLERRVGVLSSKVARLVETELTDRASSLPTAAAARDAIVPWSEGPESGRDALVPEAAPVLPAPQDDAPPAEAQRGAPPGDDAPVAAELADADARAPAPADANAASPLEALDVAPARDEPASLPDVAPRSTDAEPAPASTEAESAAESDEAESGAPSADASRPSEPEILGASEDQSGDPGEEPSSRPSDPEVRLSDPEITILGNTSSIPPAPAPETDDESIPLPPPLPPHGEGDDDAEQRPRRALGSVQEIAVLVIDTDEFVHRDMRDALSATQYRVTVASDAETGLEMARTEAPDLIFMGAKVGEESGFAILERLRRDPLTQFVPVVFVTSTTDLTERTRGLLAGAADFLPKPFEAGDVIERVQRIAVELGPEPEGVPDLGAASLPEIVRFIEREMQRGLLDSAEVPTEDLRIHLGRGGEILAATWAAVARLREVVARLSGGRVRFRAVSHGRLGVLALHAEDRVAVSSTQVSARGPAADLAGRVVLVVDDEPSVRLLFTSILGDAGASVETAADGREALVRARARRPDVVVSDILMPGMDGWELCGAIRNDFALRDIPIVLLSWKEDYFQRMKELSAGADEYLLKEAQRTQVLDRLRTLLRPRALLEARLSAGREVHGRVDATGIVTLIRAVATVRGDAKVTIRENWNLFELELRAGRPISCTRTATDGSFSRGPTAFSEMLGVDGGRYSVGAATAGARRTLEGDLEDVIQVGAHHINELVRLVVGGAAMRIGRMTLKQESLEAYLRAAPDRVRTVVQALARGQTPRELVLEGSTSLLELERILLDLVKRGGVDTIEAPAPETHITMPPPTPDQRRWDTLRSEDHTDAGDDEDDEDDDRGGDDDDEVEPIPPSADGRRSRPSSIPAEAPLFVRTATPSLPPDGRPSLAPMTMPAVRSSSAQTRLAWTLVIIGAIVGVALWAYNLSSMARRPVHVRRAAETAPLEAATVEREPARDQEEARRPPPAPPSPGPTLAEQVVVSPALGPADASTQTGAVTPPAPVGEPEPTEEPSAPRGPPDAQSGTLQVLPGSPDAEGVEVLVDGELKGTVPMSIAVAGGLHEIRLRRREGMSILRYVYVPAGESRRLIVPRIQ